MLEALSRVIRSSKVVVRLELREANFGVWQDQTGAKILAKALATNTVLEFLDISDNCLGNLDMMKFIAPAVHNTHVKGGRMTMDVRNNELSEESYADLQTSFMEHIILE